MGADEVWASPSTVTGSIGVFGMFPTFAKSLENLGIRSDGVGTTRMAGKMRLDRPLDPDLRRVFQYATERTYDDFVNLVAEQRNLDREQVLENAEGRVWSGAQAKERGLVDQMGTLRQAADAAARIAGLGSDYDLVYDERELSAFESLLIEMTGSVAARFDLGSDWLPAIQNPVARDVLEDLRLLAQSSEELVVAAHCLCDVD
jgi:protease-4